MRNELERQSFPVLWRQVICTVSVTTSARKAARWWRRIPAELRAIVVGLVVGIVAGELVVRWGAHQNLSTYMAFAPAGIEYAGVPRSEMDSAAERGVVRSLKDLLDKYDAFCRQHPIEAMRRHIDCEHVHRMDSEPVPND